MQFPSLLADIVLGVALTLAAFVLWPSLVNELHELNRGSALVPDRQTERLASPAPQIVRPIDVEATVEAAAEAALTTLQGSIASRISAATEMSAATFSADNPVGQPTMQPTVPRGYWGQPPRDVAGYRIAEGRFRAVQLQLLRRLR